MKKIISFIILLTCASIGYAQQLIPQTLVYRDSVPYFYAWKNNVIQTQQLNRLKNETLYLINGNVVDTIRSRYTIFARNISSNDKQREDIIYKSGDDIYRFFPKTGKIDTLIRDIPRNSTYQVAIGNQLIGYANEIDSIVGCFIISYDINTKRNKVSYEIEWDDAWETDYSIWGLNASTTGQILVCLGSIQEGWLQFYTYDIEKRLVLKKDYSAYMSRSELYDNFSFSHDDISAKYMIFGNFWLDSFFDIVQPTLGRSPSIFSNFQSFKLNENDNYYYLRSRIDETLRKNGDRSVWLACRFTLPFDMCLYKIYNNELLGTEEINGFDEWELNKLRNMVFAKHGYQFKSEYLQAFFNLFDFYNNIKKTDDVTNSLTPIDKKNLEVIQLVSKEK